MNFRYCEWFSPNGTRYDPDEEISGIRVIVDSRRDECVLIFESLSHKDSGPWECVAEDDRGNEASKFIVVSVTNQNEQFQLLVNADETSLDVRRGDDVHILCPTNHRSSTPQQRKITKMHKLKSLKSKH